MKRNILRRVQFNVLSQQQIEKIHEESLKILSNIGIKVTGAEMLKKLKDNGAELCENDIVKIPRALIEKAMKTVPKEVNLYNRDGELVCSMNDTNNIYFGSIAEQLEYLDYKRCV